MRRHATANFYLCIRGERPPPKTKHRKKRGKRRNEIVGGLINESASEIQPQPPRGGGYAIASKTTATIVGLSCETGKREVRHYANPLISRNGCNLEGATPHPVRTSPSREEGAKKRGQEHLIQLVSNQQRSNKKKFH